MPPVMMRGSLTGAAAPSRKPGKTRRRYDVALDVPGAELRLPALPQVHIGWRLVSGVMTIVLLAALYHVWNSPAYRVDEAEVTGLQRLSSVDVNAVLDVADEPIFTLSAAELQKKLIESFPEFSQVSVEIALRDKVLVTVEERLPILTWRQEGRTTLVDANGVAFPQRDSSAEVPALAVEASSAPPGVEQVDSGESILGMQSVAYAPQFMPVEMVSAILSMSGQAPPNSVLVYDAQHGLGWKAAEGWEVYFGDMKDMGMKLNVYQALVKTFQRNDIHPVLISVEHVHAPYYRLER
jgi:hypothetical protein